MTTPDHTPPGRVRLCAQRRPLRDQPGAHRALRQGAVTALSGGTQPGDHIHAEVAAALEKLGLDTAGENPSCSPATRSRPATWPSPWAVARNAPTCRA